MCYLWQPGNVWSGRVLLMAKMKRVIRVSGKHVQQTASKKMYGLKRLKEHCAPTSNHSTTKATGPLLPQPLQSVGYTFKSCPASMRDASFQSSKTLKVTR